MNDVRVGMGVSARLLPDCEALDGLVLMDGALRFVLGAVDEDGEEDQDFTVLERRLWNLEGFVVGSFGGR